jgi:hypothetical protein
MLLEGALGGVAPRDNVHPIANAGCVRAPARQQRGRGCGPAGPVELAKRATVPTVAFWLALVDSVVAGPIASWDRQGGMGQASTRTFRHRGAGTVLR